MIYRIILDAYQLDKIIKIKKYNNSKKTNV